MVREGVTIEGLVQVQNQLNDLFQRGQDMSPLMDQIGAYGEESSRYRFESQIGADGKRFEPSARVKAKGGQTLKDSGQYEASITWAAGGDFAQWGTNWPFAHVHQDGMTIRAKGDGPMRFNIPGVGFRSAMEVVIPARPIFGIDSADQDEIGALVTDFIRGPLQ